MNPMSLLSSSRFFLLLLACCMPSSQGAGWHFFALPGVTEETMWSDVNVVKEYISFFLDGRAGFMGLDPNKVFDSSDDFGGGTMLHFYSEVGGEDYLSIVLGLPGVDPNKTNSEGLTPFFIACERGHLALVVEFLSCSAVELNAKNNEGVTPFLIACDKERWDIVRLLVKHPLIDIDARDIDGRDAAIILEEKGQEELLALLEYQQRLRINDHLFDIPPSDPSRIEESEQDREELASRLQALQVQSADVVREVLDVPDEEILHQDLDHDVVGDDAIVDDDTVVTSLTDRVNRMGGNVGSRQEIPSSTVPLEQRMRNLGVAIDDMVDDNLTVVTDFTDRFNDMGGNIQSREEIPVLSVSLEDRLSSLRGNIRAVRRSSLEGKVKPIPVQQRLRIGMSGPNTYKSFDEYGPQEYGCLVLGSSIVLLAVGLPAYGLYRGVHKVVGSNKEEEEEA